MKATISLGVGIVLVCVCSSWGQQPQIYDNAYHGPTNYYGQPTYKVMQSQQRARQQAYRQAQYQRQSGGIIPKTFNSLQRVGGYLWSYMPAPVRGGQSPHYVPPQSGSVTINFVPGSP